MSNVALIIIYNHRFDRNIEIIERIYSSRFSNIFHLMPFYTGNKPNVIPVYENALFFQGFINQGFKSFFHEDIIHYFFIADDLILNPCINEENYQQIFELTNSTCFIPHFLNLHSLDSFWPRVREAYKYKMRIRNVDVINELPSYNDALTKFAKFDLKLGYLRYDQIWNKKIYSLRGFIRRLAFEKGQLIKYLFRKVFRKNLLLPYPMVGSYSDICIISSDSIKNFCHYCGVFAATNLHVEIALPTAIVLAADDVRTEDNLDYKGKALWPDGWNRLHGENDFAKNDFREMERYNFQLKLLLEDFPKNYLYLHPIKLSNWNINL